MSLFFKGSGIGTHGNGRVITEIPGFASVNPEEPIQFMNPGLYYFEFDSDNLVQIDDYVNGRDFTEYRKILPGVIGYEGESEVIINIPTEMYLASLDLIEEICDGDISYHARNYLIDVLHQNQELYGFSVEEIAGLGM